ncbi:MAG: hypothetical protein RL644_1053 [Actinomycetota bacterium]|jgi:pimeloyl-ACP methyl ester carboxylesterase
MLTLVTSVLVASCGGASVSTDTTVPADSTLPAAEYRIEWEPCIDSFADGSECGTMKVPFDYANPEVGTFTLALRRHPAQVPSERIGSLLVNPGGPGFGGTYLAEQATSIFGGDLLDRFDIVGWDPRGTGDSEPAIDCVDEYDRYFAYDPTPENDEERQQVVDLSKEYADICGEKNGEMLSYVSTNNSARDMDAIRQALGEEKISYLGFSYGSELGATWATMFPGTVRAAVLDGAADPTADSVEGGLQQAAGFEKELNAFFDQCAKDSMCPFHNNGDPGAAFDRLAEKVDSEPVKVAAGRTPVNQSVLYTAVSEAMYSSSMWGDLEIALDELQSGDGKAVLDFYDQYYQRNSDGSYGNELEAFLAISCIDDPGPKTVEESDKWLPDFLEAAPRLGASFASGYWCVFWPARTDYRTEITGKGAGPIIVVGTTGDSATPLASSRKMAETLEDGRLIVLDAQRHTGYGANDCVTGAVNDFLITTEVSFREKSC